MCWLSNVTHYFLGQPKEGLYNSAVQKNSFCLSVVIYNQNYNRLIQF